MKTTYKTTGTCSQEITVEINNGVIGDVLFTGGCSGNLKAVSTLVKGMKATDAVQKLKGIRCGSRQTSCADQLAHAILENTSL